jgi:hypothetical protein
LLNALDPEAVSSVTEPKPVNPTHDRICYYLLGAGAVTFALGDYTGFVRHGDPVLVFILLGASIALFASALLAGLKQHAIKGAHPSKATPHPEAEAASQEHAKPHNQHDDDAVILMKTTLADLLLAAVRQDPVNAQRLFAQAGVQAQAPTAAAPAE